MKRILTFLAAFLAVAILLLGGIVLWNRDAFQTLFSNREGMAEGSEWIEDTYSLSGLVDYIQRNPGPVTVVSAVLERPDSLLSIHPRTPRPMGNLGNLLLLMAYSEGFSAGAIDSNAVIPWSEVGRWQIPGVLEPAHRSLERHIEPILDGQGGLRLGDALGLLPVYNDVALSDWLLNRYGREAMRNFIDRMGLKSTEPLVPQAGIYLMSRELDPDTFRERYELADSSSWEQADVREARMTLHDLAWQMASDFAADDAASRDLRERIDGERLGLTFMQERDALTLFPMSTGDDLAMLMQSLAQETLLAPDASRRVLEWLSWPMQNPDIRRDFTRYGALYDSRMGMLGGIDIGTSRYTGDTTVQSVLFDRLPVGFWFHLSANHMHQDFQQRLIYDPALISSVRSAITRMEPESDADVPPSATPSTDKPASE